MAVNCILYNLVLASLLLDRSNTENPDVVDIATTGKRDRDGRWSTSLCSMPGGEYMD